MSYTISKIVQNQHNIIYVENQGVEPYSKIVYKDRSEIVCGNVGMFEKELDSSNFLRVNRKTLVNIKFGRVYKGEVLTPVGRIAFSRRKWRQFISKDSI